MGIKSFGKSQWDAVAHPEQMSEERVTRTRRALIGFLVAVFIIGVLLFFLNPQNKGGNTGAAPGDSVPTVTAPADAVPGTDGCLDNTPKDISAKAPAVEQWVAKASGQMPVIKGAGPCGKPVGGVDTGFAKTQTGALAAAATWFWQLEGPVTPSTPDALRAVVVAGPDRDALEAQAKRILSGAQSQGTDYRGITKLAGYRIQFHDDAAVVDLGFVSQVGSDQINGTARLNMRWVDGDWKLIPEGPETLGRGSKVDSLDGYIPFSAEVTNASH